MRDSKLASYRGRVNLVPEMQVKYSNNGTKTYSFLGGITVFPPELIEQ